MIELRTLGTLDLRAADGRDLTPILAQPKRLALLTYLTLASANGRPRRDTILGLFWPDLDQQHAQGALRQAVWFLRRELGEGVLVGRVVEELGVSEQALCCDAVVFERACQSGDAEAALAVYRGDFLPGFFVADAAAELEQWIEDERVRLRRRAGRAAWSLAERSEAGGDAAAALEWARRGVSVAPDDEAQVSRLIALLDRLSDPEGALQVYQDFARRLARAGEDEPSAEIRALLAAVRSRPRRAALVAVSPSTADPPAVHIPQVGRSPTVPAGVAALPRRVRATLALAMGATMLAVGGYLVAFRPEPTAVALDPGKVAVLPFRVSGSDSSLGYLREGMIDLLAPKLTGEGGPQAVSPQAVMSAWRRAVRFESEDLRPQAAVELARDLGAGLLLLGGAVGTRDRLAVSTTLVRVPDGRTMVQAAVHGPPDSLLSLVDQLVAQLLVRNAGEPEERLADLMTRSPLALRAYLSGQAAYRAGRYEAARESLAQAVRRDTSFALAGLALAAAAGYWGDPNSAAGVGLKVAWAFQDRLSRRDRTFLRFVGGKHYPAGMTLWERVENGEQAVAMLPERVEVWYGLGDELFHWGSFLGIPDAEQRAAAAFDRALAIDSMYTYALEHRIEVAARAGDAATVRRLRPLYLRATPVGQRTGALHWLIATALGDSATVRALRRRFDSLPVQALSAITWMAQQDLVSPADAERALAAWKAHAGRSEEWSMLQRMQHDFALNRGRPREALAAIESSRSVEPPNHPSSEGRSLVYDGLFWEGDPDAARLTADSLAARAWRPLARDLLERDRQYNDICVLELWRLAHGETASTARAVATLRSAAVPRDDPQGVADNTLCAAMLDAWLTAERHAPGAAAAIRLLDTLLTRGPWVFYDYRDAAVLILARAREQQRDVRGALETVRRRVVGWVPPAFLSTSLREEGRLAALTGDTVGAVKAYRHYRDLRASPEPALGPLVQQVLEELAKLERHPQGRAPQ